MNPFQVKGVKLSTPAPVKKTSTGANIQKKMSDAKKQIKKAEVNVNNQTKKKQVKKLNMNKEQSQKKNNKKQPQKKQQKQLKKQQNKEIQTQNSSLSKQQIQSQKQPPKIFEVLAKYNHYKQKFECVNNILYFKAPNQKYSFGHVFKGNYKPILRNFASRDIIQPLSIGKAEDYSWRVIQGQIYQIQIQQDEQQEAKYQRHVYKAPEKAKQCPFKKNSRVQDLTNQMKNLDANQFGSQKHRQLLQQRDLQDILYS